MASVLDIALLDQFNIIFVFVFVFVLVYAILKMTKVLGDNPGLNALISLAIAVMFIFSDKAINMITFMIPWFIVMGVFIMLVVLNYRILGGEGGVLEALGDKHKTVAYWIVIIGILIVVMALANNYGQSVGPYLDENGGSSTDGVYRNASSPIEQISGIGDGARGTGAVDTGDFQQNLGATLFHPKVLGMVLILVIASFTIMFMIK